MALEDFVDPEVGIAVAATAIVASPQARAFVRRGLVVGLAGLMRMGNAASSAARAMADSAQADSAPGAGIVAEARTQATTSAAKPRKGAQTTPPAE